MLSDEEIDELVHSNVKAFEVFLRGYALGITEGMATAALSDEQAADLAARKFYALEQWEIDNRRRLQIDREWFAVERARREQRRSTMNTERSAA